MKICFLFIYHTFTSTSLFLKFSLKEGNISRSFQFSSVAQLCPTVCNPMDCSMPGFPVHHQCPEPTKTQVHCVSDAIQPSHPLSSPSPPAFTPWTVDHQAPLSMGFSWQQYWSVLPCPSLGDLSNPGIKCRSPALQVDSLPAEPQGKPFALLSV